MEWRRLHVEKNKQELRGEVDMTTDIRDNEEERTEDGPITYFNYANGDEDKQYVAQNSDRLARETIALLDDLDRTDPKKNATTAPSAPYSAPQGSAGRAEIRGTGEIVKESGGGTEQAQLDWEKSRAEARSRYRASKAAAAKAEAAKREELLATGLYYDDGRGNIRLREKLAPGQDGRVGRNRVVATPFNDRSAATAYAIKQAGRAAFENSMEAAVEANRAEMAQMKADKARRAADNAEGEVAVFDSLVAALDDMRTSNRIKEEVVGGSRGVEIVEDGKRYMYKDGKKVPVPEGKKTGMSIRSGFLSPTRIKALNGELERLGSNRRVTGITVRQKFNSQFPEKKIGEPMFYVQGYRFDPESRKSSQYGQWMTMKDVYRMGLTNAKVAGGMFANTHSEESIREMLDDVYGTGTRAREASKAATAVQVGKLAIEEEKNRLERDKFEYEQRKNILDAAMEFEKRNRRPANDIEFVNMLPESMQKNLLEPVEVLGDDGIPVVDDMGNTMTRPPTAEEVGARIKQYRGLLQMEGNARKTPFEQIVGLLNPAAAKIGDSTATLAKQPTKEELLAEKARRQQAGKAGGAAATNTASYGMRNDGKTYKGTGWLGEIKLPDGGVASEYTVGVNIGGKEVDIPTLVPGLTRDEVNLMANDIIPNGKPVPESIMQKAVDHARMRMSNGQSVFANDGAPALTEKAKGLADKMAKGKGAAPAPEPTPTSTPAPAPEKSAAESKRRKLSGAQTRARAELTSRYRTVQDVARDVVKALNDSGEISSIVNPDGTRRTNLTPQEKSAIIYNVHKKFTDAGMSDFWDREVEEYTPQNYGGRLSQDAIIDKLFRDWNNKTAPFAYGYKRKPNNIAQ